MSKLNKKNRDSKKNTKNTRISESVKCRELEERANQDICEWGTKHGLLLNDEETNRTVFRRHRDRILYSGGFRRLQDKTQVLGASLNGDHRTRLTHSLEVEQIAINLADSLGLNKDLVSAIALGHDVGHTPFGHAVERYLDERLVGKGGFSHAVQSVRYLSNNNVELSELIIEGILKHDTDIYLGAYDKKQFDCSMYKPDKPGNLESQVVYWADKIAYITHDFEDFYNTEIYKEAVKNDGDLKGEMQKILAKLTYNEEILVDIKKFETRNLIRNLLKNLTDNSIDLLNGKENGSIANPELAVEVTIDRIKKIEEEKKLNILEEKLNRSKNESEKIFDGFLKKFLKRMDKFNEKEKRILTLKDEIRKIKKSAYQEGLLINFEKDYRLHYFALRKILDKHYIMSPEVQRSDAKAIKLVNSIYNEFVENFRILPLNIQKKIDSGEESKERLIADYIASMTDKYAEQVYNNLNSMGSYYKY